MRCAALLLGWGLALLVGPASAAAEFGFEDFGLAFRDPAGQVARQAGSHPFELTTSFDFETRVDPVHGEVPDEAVKNLAIELPAGLVGNPAAAPRCPSGDFIDIDSGTKLTACPNATAVGVVALKTLLGSGGGPTYVKAAVHNLEPPRGTVQRLGFSAYGVPVTINLTIHPGAPYSVDISLANLSQVLPVYGAELVIWGQPADPVHDPIRGECLDIVPGPDRGFDTNGQSCPADTAVVPFLTLPRSCSSPLETGYRIDSWAQPGVFISGSVPVENGETPPGPLTMAGCEELEFSPTVEIRPTNGESLRPTGLELGLRFEDEGLLSPGANAQSDVESATVALPDGLVVNSAAANGLAACSPAELSREAPAPTPAGCPGSSKIGTARLETPLLGEALSGEVFVAQPDDPSTLAAGAENPFDSLLALYVVVRSAELGVVVKQPVEVEADGRTGRLVARAGDLPQIPFGHLELNLREGPRAPLVSPSRCGAYAASARLVPRSDPASVLTRTSAFAVTGDPDRCAAAGSRLPFAPVLRAGALSARAGAASPFVLRIARDDGSEPIGSVRMRLPAGLSARLAGIPYCPEALIALAGQTSGRAQQRDPSCPGASRVGSVEIGAGAGSIPLHLGGDAYLAGPYEGAPLSLAVVIPALAGPFDLGSVTVRVALRVDPETGRIEAVSDPIPTILSGIPLNVQTFALNLDRPGFTRNPTSCEPTATAGEATSALGGRATLSEHFQVRGCGSLGFEPRLRSRLLGPVHRGGHPSLRAVVRARSADAGIDGIAIRLPKTALLETRHIKQVCTPRDFDDASCPRSSAYGFVKAWSPLLDRPIAGPLFLRGSKRGLPDLAASLRGQIRLDLSARVDARRGRLRASFRGLPDVPFEKVVLNLWGGDRGLLVNSGGLCSAPRRLAAVFVGKNGKRHLAAPLLRSGCPKR